MPFPLFCTPEIDYKSKTDRLTHEEKGIMLVQPLGMPCAASDGGRRVKQDAHQDSLAVEHQLLCPLRLGRPPIPDDWAGIQVRIHFEAVTGFSEVYVGKEKVGENYITDKVRPGQIVEVLVGVRSQ